MQPGPVRLFLNLAKKLTTVGHKTAMLHTEQDQALSGLSDTPRAGIATVCTTCKHSLS